MRSTTMLCLAPLALLTGIFATMNPVAPVVPIETDIGGTAAFSTAPASVLPQLVPRTFVACDIAIDNCGSITPSSGTVYIADGAYNSTDGTIFWVDVPSYGDGVFQMDPATCSVIAGTYYSVNGGLSQRGIGFDPENYQIWTGGWNDTYLNQLSAEPPYSAISYTYTGLTIASIAVDDADNFLFIGTNNYPDYVYVYDITGGSLGSLLGAWQVPWQTPTDGFDMAGMGYDDDAGQLIMVNQYGAYSGTERETFDFDISTGLTGAGWCDLAYTSFGWGIAILEDGSPGPLGFFSYVTDLGDLDPPVDIDLYGIPGMYVPPSDLICWVTSENDVQLTWVLLINDYWHIRVYRNTELIATLPGDAESCLDTGPGAGHYVYRVCGVIWGGGYEVGDAECELDIYPSGGVCFDFNDTDGGWIAGGTEDGYEWGSPSSVFEGNAWETNIGGTYTNDACTWVDSPSIRLGPGGGIVTFDSFDFTECYHDGWTLQISLDGDVSFSCIDPVGGYGHGTPAGADGCPEFLDCGSNCGYSVGGQYNFDLTGLPDTTVIFRFVFTSDERIAYRGHVFDNFCVYGGSMPTVLVQCQLLNPDMDGDGVRDVHVGDYLYYSATFVNLNQDPLGYGAEHLVYARQSYPDPGNPVREFGPACKGTLPGGGIRTHYYRVRVPNNDNLLNWNPFAVQVAAWVCDGGVPLQETGRCCFDVTLLPAWEPPPVPEPLDAFIVEEIDGPPPLETPG